MNWFSSLYFGDCMCKMYEVTCLLVFEWLMQLFTFENKTHYCVQLSGKVEFCDWNLAFEVFCLYSRIFSAFTGGFCLCDLYFLKN